MNLRESLYFALVASRGQALGSYYKRFLRETEEGIPCDTTEDQLAQLLAHCSRSVPYYAEIMKARGGSFKEDPVEYLRDFPILTKDVIRSELDALKSTDLSQRKWFFNTSGGSTGEPVRFIQDWEYAARSGAVKLLFSRLIGKQTGEREIQFWGSARDISQKRQGVAARGITWLTNTTTLSVFRLDPDIILRYVDILNKRKPKLIVGYTSSMYEMAKYAMQNQLEVSPQNAIIVTAGTLYPYMREAIESVFHCPVYDRYGSREVGDIACERPGQHGLWVAPWSNYVEIVDEDGNRVEDGEEGEILVTSLANYAMPLLRYRIGDRGVLLPSTEKSASQHGQVLGQILGRTYDLFVNANGSMIEGGYFMALLYFRDWIARYQVVQKTPSSILFKIVKSCPEIPPGELDEIAEQTCLIMGDPACETRFEFVDHIPASDSGKYRFIRSEIPVHCATVRSNEYEV